MRFDADGPYERALRYARRAILPHAQRRARRALDRVLPAWALGASPEAFPPDALDLLYLYRLVRTRRPRVIVEYGSGYSTSVFAAALMQNGAGQLFSVESDAQWARITRARLPREAPVKIEEVASVEEWRGWRFGWLAPSPPDLLYVDGPPTTPETPITFDAEEEAARMSSGAVIVVDGREQMFARLIERLPTWRASYHWLRWNGTLVKR